RRGQPDELADLRRGLARVLPDDHGQPARGRQRHWRRPRRHPLDRGRRPGARPGLPPRQGNSAGTGDDHGRHERPARAVAWPVGASAVPASVRVVAFIGDQPRPGLVVGGWLLMALATLAGAWLAGRDRGPRQVWLGAAAGALLAIAGLHLLPDA